jgi:ABC-2 type transport system ATP-binding protein
MEARSRLHGPNRTPPSAMPAGGATIMSGMESKVNTPPATIRLDGLTFAYTTQPVLEDVSCELAPAAIGLLGPNGSGKTTLLRALLGHLQLPRGKVHVLGQDMAARGRLGWMPERGGIIPGMSGVSLCSYLGELAGMPAVDAMQRAHEVLDYVGLGEARYRPCEDYSQGMKQRLKLAQALVHDPAWVFLDEPTSGLDPKGRVAILQLVRDLATTKGLGVILSTHLLPDVEMVCNEILVLRKGRLLAHEEVDRHARADKQVFEVEGFGDEERFHAALRAAGAELELDGRRWALVTVHRGDGANLILKAALETGYAMRRLRRQTIRLEDVFYKLVEE